MILKIWEFHWKKQQQLDNTCQSHFFAKKTFSIIKKKLTREYRSNKVKEEFWMVNQIKAMIFIMKPCFSLLDIINLMLENILKSNFSLLCSNIQKFWWISIYFLMLNARAEYKNSFIHSSRCRSQSPFNLKWALLDFSLSFQYI